MSLKNDVAKCGNGLQFGDTNHSLPKAIVIKKKSLLNEIFTSGCRVRGEYGQLIVLKNESLKVAFIVGKSVGNATTRNRLRRYLREFFRTHKRLMPKDRAIALQIFPKKPLPDYQKIETEFTNLCQKLSLP